jgi:amino acid transporter
VLAADYVDAWVKGSLSAAPLSAAAAAAAAAGSGSGAGAGHDGVDEPRGLAIWARFLIMFSGLLLGTFSNLRGLGAVEAVSTALVILVLTPFAVLFAIVLGRGEVDPVEWGSMSKTCSIDGIASYDACIASGGTLTDHIDYSTLISVLLWAWMGWDSLGAIAGEVRNPRRSFPLGMMLATVLNLFTYAIPIVTAVAVGGDYGIWDDGFFVAAAREISPWIAVWVLGAVILGNFGQFNSCLSTDARSLWALSGGSASRRRDPFAPRFLSLTWTRYGTPAASVLCCALTTLVLMNLDFAFLVNLNVFLNNVTLVLLLAAFIAFRWRDPGRRRPYRVPGGWPGVVACSAPLAAVIIISFATSSPLVLLSGCGFMALVMAAYVVKILLRRRKARLAAPI